MVDVTVTVLAAACVRCGPVHYAPEVAGENSPDEPVECRRCSAEIPDKKYLKVRDFAEFVVYDGDSRRWNGAGLSCGVWSSRSVCNECGEVHMTPHCCETRSYPGSEGDELLYTLKPSFRLYEGSRDRDSHHENPTRTGRRAARSPLSPITANCRRRSSWLQRRRNGRRRSRLLVSSGSLGA
jgi:hypothetical protein